MGDKRAVPKLVAFDLTTRCNLHCIHCYNESGRAYTDELTKEEMHRVVEELARLQPVQVCLCGGEPLLSPYLFQVIERLRFHVGRLAMVSNGFFIDAEMAERLVAAGVSTVQISLDGAEAWQHDSFRGMTGAFDRAIQAIQQLKRAGMKQVAVSLIPNQLNLDSLEAYFSLCSSLGVDIVRMMPMLPSGRGGRLAAQRLALDASGQFQCCRSIERARQQYADISIIEWTDPVASVQWLWKVSRKSDCPLSFSLKADGWVALDSYLPFVVGNVRDTALEALYGKRLSDAWKSSAVQHCVESIHCVNDFAAINPFVWCHDGEKPEWRHI